MPDSFFPDGLLEPISLADLSISTDEPSHDPVADALRRVGDVRVLSQIVWPAFVDGVLVRPPEVHLVDWILRTYLLQDPPSSVAGTIALRPEAHTIVAVDGLPRCNYCNCESARYDASLKGNGGWAMMCSACYCERGSGWLGMGRGQYQTAWDELLPGTREAISTAIDHWDSQGLDVSALSFI